MNTYHISMRLLVNRLSRLGPAAILLIVLAISSLGGSPASVAVYTTPFAHKSVTVTPHAPAVTWTVTSTADSGAGTLRQAIADASPGDTIQFNLTYPTVITLTGGELSITKTLAITGPGAANLVVSGNDASRVFSINAGVTVTITDLAIAYGHAPDVSFRQNGGGIYNFGTLTLQRCDLHDNRAGNSYDYDVSGGTGGGVFNFGGATLSIVDSSIRSNHSGLGVGHDGFGGAIANGGTLTIFNSTFSANSANRGGGGGIYHWGALMISNSTFSSNSAGGLGGGIFNDGGTLTISNSTFSANSASIAGGGIFNDSTLHLSNSILVNAAAGRDCANTGTLVTNIRNLIGDGTCSPYLSGDPMLGPLGDNGGPTQTFALLPGSSAIDAGNAPTCAGLPGGDLDQRGKSRVGTCDIGAFESGKFILAIGGGNNQSATIGTTFASNLQVTVTSNASPAEPVDGGKVIFTVPGAGASATLSNYTPTISDSSVNVSATANITRGSYLIGANTGGATTGVNFSLTNVSIDLAVTQSYQLNFLHDITFTLTARNLGPDAAANAVVSDTFPAGSMAWSWTFASSGGTTCTASGSGNIGDTLTSFPSGGVVTYTVHGNLANWSHWINTVEVIPLSGVTDINPDDNWMTVGRYQVLIMSIFKNTPP